MTRTGLWQLPLLTFALATACPLRASEPLPAGLADPAGRTGYLTMVRGHLEAIDLTTGDTLWANTKVHRALLVSGDRLFALGKEGAENCIFILDLLARGEVVLKTDRLPLPEWVSPREEAGHTFRFKAQLVPEYLEVHWEARAWHVGREKLTPEQEASARKHATGLLRIHLLTGKVEGREAEFPQPPQALPPATLRESIRWSTTHDQWLFAVVVGQTSVGQAATLRTWVLKTGEELPPRPLLTGRRLQVMPGLGDRQIFVRDALPSPADANTQPVRWHIWNLDQGDLLGRVPYEPGTQPGSVVGRRAFFIKSEGIGGRLNQPFTQPRVLQAFDLTTGKLAWERPIEGKPVVPPSP